MLYYYKAANKDGARQEGTIDAVSDDVAISSLQKRGLIVLEIKAEKRGGFLSNFSIFNRVSSREVVILSRQIATLFEAKVSVLATFRLLATEAQNPFLNKSLTQVTDDIRGGMSISDALARHPQIFSPFYVNMVRAGEESGKLPESFNYLADYLERSYELINKARNALIYPAFILSTFVIVLGLLLIFVIPRLTEILVETGQELPIYTKLVIGVSDFAVNYSLVIIAFVVIIAFFLSRYLSTKAGRLSLARFKLSIPYVGTLYKKLYLSRISDNLNTMLTSGISMVRGLEITAAVVDNEVFSQLLMEAAKNIKGGESVSTALARYPEEIPGLMVQMIQVGEESGKMSFIFDTMSRFYVREVNNAVDTLVGLIEPALIIILAFLVGLLLTSILVPIYNLASGI